MSRETQEKSLSTADLVAGTRTPSAEAQARTASEKTHDDPRNVPPATATREADMMPSDAGPSSNTSSSSAQAEHEQLAALFPTDRAEDFRSRWDAVQIGFVDDPKQAVQKADELVAQVMKSLAESFARQRSSIEADVGKDDQASTEHLRVALRSYRSFFQRLLSL
jgi:hypothetical protein